MLLQNKIHALIFSYARGYVNVFHHVQKPSPPVRKPNSAPDTVVGELTVPLLGALPHAGNVWIDVLREQLFVQALDAETGRVGDLYEAVLNKGIRQAVDHVAPPGNIHRVVFEREHVVHRGRGLDGGHAGDGALRHVDRHGDAVFIGDVAYLLQLKRAAAGENVGVDDRNAAGLYELFVALLEVDVLTGADGHAGRIAQAYIVVGVYPRGEVLYPCEVVLLHAAAEADAAFKLDMAEVVDRERDVIADNIADLLHVVLKIIESLFGDLDAGEGVRGGDYLIALLMLHHVRGDAAALRVEDMGGVLFHVVNKAERGVDGSGLVKQQADAEVHLEEGEAHVHTLLECKTHVVPGVLAVNIGIGIDAYLVTVLAAEHLVKRYAVCLARKIPQRNLDTGHTAALTGVPAELLYFVEDLIDVAGVLANDAALEHECVGLARSVAHFAIADEALIGHKLHYGAALGSVGDIDKAHIGDLKLAGRGILIKAHSGFSLYRYGLIVAPGAAAIQVKCC